MAITWIKHGKRTSPEGTTIIYYGLATDLSIESRKRHIPHANGKPGTWDLTTYWVLWNGKEIAQKYSLKDAKEYAEEVNDGK